MNLYRFRDQEDYEIAEVLAMDEESAVEAMTAASNQSFELIEEERDVDISEYLPVVVKNNFRPY